MAIAGTIEKPSTESRMLREADETIWQSEDKINKANELKKLIHHKDTTVGLWAADRKIEDIFKAYEETGLGNGLSKIEYVNAFVEWANKEFFFQIDYK